MEGANALDGLPGKQETHATFREAHLVAASLDYRDRLAREEACSGGRAAPD